MCLDDNPVCWSLFPPSEVAMYLTTSMSVAPFTFTGLWNWSFGLYDQISYTIFISPMHATCPLCITAAISSGWNKLTVCNTWITEGVESWEEEAPEVCGFDNKGVTSWTFKCDATPNFFFFSTLSCMSATQEHVIQMQIVLTQVPAWIKYISHSSENFGLWGKKIRT